MGSDDFDFTPVVILGAGRSGTNMLRDAMTALDGFATWPCDEINPIWRHGNIGWPDDEIPAGRAVQARVFIRRAFRRIWREQGRPAFVVEKTCANTLRVPFVDAVIPEARYIHILRDGVDVVASAQKRWKGRMELASLPYYWAKIKYAPLADLPAYGMTFVRNRLTMRRSEDGRMAVWGPRFAGMDALRGASLDEAVKAAWPDGADVVLLAYGITARVARMGMELARERGAKVGFIRLIVAWPFPEKRIRELAEQVRAFVVPEINYGQIVLEVERCAAGKAAAVPVCHPGGGVHDPNAIREAILGAAK